MMDFCARNFAIYIFRAFLEISYDPRWLAKISKNLVCVSSLSECSFTSSFMMFNQNISKYGLLFISTFTIEKVVIKVAPKNCFILSFAKLIVKRVCPLRTKNATNFKFMSEQSVARAIFVKTAERLEYCIFLRICEERY